jgi:hypothetical protein
VKDDTDCDDGLASTNPSAVELCNQIDDDCVHGVDDGLTFQDWYRDQDGDGYGDEANLRNTCQALSATHVLDGSDCDDANATLNHDDVDLDGVDTCAGDCVDLAPTVIRAAVELCNNIDDNRDAVVDEGFVQFAWYADVDGDGYGDPLALIDTCVDLSATHMFDATDCDDSDAALNHDDLDLDGSDTCAGDCDDLDPQATFETEWLPDVDGDGCGAAASVGFACNAPEEGTGPEVAGIDCDDGVDTIHPGAAEICENGVDEDCSGADNQCGPVGDFMISDGPPWIDDPPVYSCIETCALLFGGVATDYHCSTDPVVLDYQAYVDGWADATYCSTPVAEDFEKENAGNPGYDCGNLGCSYSAYVLDHCTWGETNYCWER